MSEKYYAVKKGKKPGIYLTWDECKEQVDKVRGAIFKSFSNFEDAENFIGDKNVGKKELTIEPTLISMEKNKLYAFVDGSYNSKTKTVGYGLVLVLNDKIQMKDLGSFRNINFNESKNVFGEIRGALKAVELAIANDFKEINIVYDYIGISKFATKEWKAKTPVTKDYQEAIERYTKLIQINFIKVKAHADESEGGSSYNDMADKLAKKANKL